MDTREKLYNKLTKNLNLVVSKFNPSEDRYHDKVMCPLCMTYFDRSALNTKSDNHLTLEHVPPESVGGKVATLTCKLCNNQAGSKLDSSLKKKIDIDSFFNFTPNVELNARYNIADKYKTNGTLSKFVSVKLEC